MLPEINAGQVVAAFALATSIDIPGQRSQRIYEVKFRNLALPVKIVVDLAGLIAQKPDASVADAATYIATHTSEFNAVQAKERLLQLGFPVVPISEGSGLSFFSQEELSLFRHYARCPYYDDDPVVSNAGHFFSETVWEKSRYWAEQVSLQNGLKYENQKKWLSFGVKGRHKQVIKEYTWYRIRDQRPVFAEVFFTVGVSGPERALIYKLDYRTSGERQLSQSQIALFEKFCELYGLKTQSVSFEEINNLSWENLLVRTNEFIRQNIDLYHQLQVELVASNPTRFVRVCYNSLGWVQPSGREGKSSLSEDSQQTLQERDHGFAPDEWLFDTNRIMDDGYHYARVEPFTPDKHIGSVFNVEFYTFNASDKTWYWVGAIDNIEVIDHELSWRISRQYEQRGWKAEQIQELSSLEGVDWRQYESLDDGIRFNLRYRPADLRVYNLQPIPKGMHPGGRYNLVRTRKAPHISPSIQIGGLDFESTGRSNGQAALKRNYKGGQRELMNIHGEIIDSFVERAQHLFPDLTLDTEVKKKGLLHRVDMVGSAGHKPPYILFEVKTYPSLLQSIRLAVGQLLEYAFYPSQQLSDSFFIVSHIRAEQNDCAYLHHLNSHLPVSFGFIHYDRQTKTFEIQVLPLKKIAEPDGRNYGVSDGHTYDLIPAVVASGK